MNKLDRYILKNFVKSFLLGMIMFFIIFLLFREREINGLDNRRETNDNRGDGLSAIWSS